eukprot:Lankesteria_metandrocarpae@DN4474_c0_g1_i1.p1
MSAAECALATAEKNATQNSKALLKLPDGREIELDVLKPTLGDEVLLDVRSLYSRMKVLTFDPGFNSTASCKSAITYIDGDAGVCLYRGLPVHELIEADISYPEVAYLLLYGTLPCASAKASFLKEMNCEMLVHEQLKKFVETFVVNSHPMSILSSVVAAMASFYADPMSGEHIESFAERELACIRLVAKMPSVVAMIYKVKQGMPIVYPRSDLTYSENILNMMFGSPVEPYKIDAVKAQIINAFLIIHGDHEQNASTSTVRTAGSSLANPYACIAAGITSLWGKAHGGANEAVIQMLRKIGSEEDIPKFIQDVKDKKVRLMGFGHRIYRNYDPRATVMRKLCYKLFATSGKRDPLFDMAMKLEQVALTDDYFISRKLYPNVDFYSGIVMRCLGIPEDMFTVFFALGRCVGWLSHWKEMIEEQQLKISRPRQLYLGKVKTDLKSNVDSKTLKDHLSPRPFHEVQGKLVEEATPRLPNEPTASSSRN